MQFEGGDREFRTTSWTLIDAVRSDGPEASAALAQLSERYWRPVWTYLRRRGRSDDEASEAAQSFFTEVVIGRRLFAGADTSRGRLRTLILSALRNHLVDRHRRRSSQIDRPDGTLPIESVDAPADSESPDIEFDRAWAQATLEAALDRCRRYLIGHGRQRQWRAFERCVLEPAISGNCPPATKEIAAELGFETPARLVASNQSVRLRVQMHLREVVAETADDPEARADEYRHLIALLTPDS